MSPSELVGGVVVAEGFSGKVRLAVLLASQINVLGLEDLLGLLILTAFHSYSVSFLGNSGGTGLDQVVLEVNFNPLEFLEDGVLPLGVSGIQSEGSLLLIEMDEGTGVSQEMGSRLGFHGG